MRTPSTVTAQAQRRPAVTMPQLVALMLSMQVVVAIAIYLAGARV